MRFFVRIRRNLWLAGLLVVTGGSRLPAQTDWWQRSREFRTRYYSVKTDLPENEASLLADHLDVTADAYRAIFANLRVKPALLGVFLFADQQDYSHVVRTQFQTDPTGTWGLCITRNHRIALVAWRDKNDVQAMQRVLQHEGFHQFASHLFPRIPPWANEGLAELFERGVVINGSMVLGEVGAEDQRMLNTAAASDQLVPFQNIFTMPAREWGAHVRQGNPHLNYVQAWSMVHFFLYADDGKYQQPFLRFLVALNQGQPWEPAFVGAFGMPDFLVMERMWREYIENLAVTDYRETIRRLDFLAAGLLELRERGSHVQTMEDLRLGLQSIDFTYESNLFGKSQVLSAANAQLFQVPSAGNAKVRPVFELVDNRDRKPLPSSAASPKRRASARTHSPLNIVTRGMIPQDFKVRWNRVKADYEPVLELR